MLKTNTGWIGFHVVAFSSEEYGTNAELISTQPYATNKSWESSRTGQFPVEIAIRFHTRCELEHVILSSKPAKFIPEVEFHIGDGLSGSFLDVEYRLAGKAENIIDKFSQIKLHGIGSYLKLVFPKGPKKSTQNPFGQISIGCLKLWGRETEYYSKLKNEALPVTNDKSDVDKILISMGMPLDLIAWFDEDDRNFEYAPIDEDSRQTLIDLQKLRENALKREDYEALKQLSIDIRKVFDLGREIWQLLKELEFVVAKEDFSKAIEIKEKLKRLMTKRDTYDALYETSRYEQMIVMHRPSTAELLAEQRRLQEEDLLNAERLRRQKELDEQERKRLLEEERRKKGLQNDKNLDYTPFWEKNKNVDLQNKKKKAPKEKPDEKMEVGFKNIFNFNEGDADLELYFKPLLANAGDSIKEISVEILRRLHHLGYLTVFGAKIWSAAYNENWRLREAAAQAVLNFIEMPLLGKYLDGKSKRLFLASMEMAKIACQDKLLQIYFVGLKILSTALAPPVCGKDVSPQLINKVLKEFIPILITKISELNYRARDISLHTLISIFRHPAAQIGNLIVGCMDICDSEDDIKPKMHGPIDKQQWRIVLARLEIILHVLQEFGYDPNEWNWEPVFRYLIVPSLFHSNVDVRLIAVELCVTLYQLLGQEIRLAVNNIENLKPNLLVQINQRMDEVEEVVLRNQEADAIKLGLSSVIEEPNDAEDPSPSNTKTKNFRNDSKPIDNNNPTSQTNSIRTLDKVPSIKPEYQANDIKDRIDAAMNEGIANNDPNKSKGGQKQSITKSNSNAKISQSPASVNLNVKSNVNLKEEPKLQNNSNNIGPQSSQNNSLNNIDTANSLQKSKSTPNTIKANPKIGKK